MTASEHEACVVQPAHQIHQMDWRQVRDVAGIRYLEAGEPRAAPILFLHGIGGGARAFASQLEHFGRTFRAIAWEMPGYAGSVPLPLVTMAALAAALAGFIRALGLERPVLVGHSIGGMIVQRLLAEAPDAARAVVLAQTSAVFGSKDPAWAEAFIRDRLGPLDAGRSLEEMAPEAIAALVGEDADPAGVAVARECLAGVPDSTYRDMVLAMPGFDLREALPRIAAPTLVLAGSLDRNAPAGGMERMAGRIPGARFVVLEGVGHLAYAERPAEFNAAVDGFLAGGVAVNDAPVLAEADAPIFDPRAFRLDGEQAALLDRVRRLAATRFAPRAAELDREARFPTENYRDLRDAGLLAICIPKAQGGLGASYLTYSLAGAEIGRYCGATALTWNMHVCSTLWTGPLADDLDLSGADRAAHERRRALHYRRIVGDGAVYSQPFSEGGPAAAGAAAFGTEAQPVDGGWRVSGTKIFASLSGHADYYGVLCTERGPDEAASRRNTLYLAVPADAPGVSVTGDWDPLGMRATVSRTLRFRDVFVPEEAALMPRGVYSQAASRWPHMFLTLSPTYMGLAQAAYDFTVRYLRGEAAGTPPVKRRQYPTKQLAVAEMRVKLEAAKALWFQSVSEAGPDPSKDQVMRAWAAQFTVMETANDLARLAIRTCGGQAMLRTLPLERLYRDSRCGSLMLPWTAELCLDRLGRAALYEEGESDS